MNLSIKFKAMERHCPSSATRSLYYDDLKIYNIYNSIFTNHH